ncbi:hypothetical protein BC833DRAFT_566614, partial [Globomyces pollinis-pini]
MIISIELGDINFKAWPILHGRSNWGKFKTITLQNLNGKGWTKLVTDGVHKTVTTLQNNYLARQQVERTAIQAINLQTAISSAQTLRNQHLASERGMRETMNKFISIEDRIIADEKLCLSKLQNSPDSTIRTAYNQENSKDLWDKLRSDYEEMATRGIAIERITLDDHVSEEDIIMQLMNGLPKEFDYVCDSLKHSSHFDSENVLLQLSRKEELLRKGWN